MIDFIKYRNIFFIISGCFLIPSITALIFWGVKPAIDFTGGSLLELEFVNYDEEYIDTEVVADKINEIEGVELSSVQTVTDTNNIVLRMNDIDQNKKTEIINKLNELSVEKNNDKDNSDDPGSFSIKEERFESIGPVLGRELLIKTGVAVLLVSLILLFYIAKQFKDPLFGISAILAMFHDTLILIGIFAMLGKFYNVEVDTLFVTAMLTTLSFSVHDTIVLFDRIREVIKDDVADNLKEAINVSLNQTLMRSLNNSLTTILMLAALAFLGGVTIKWFVIALLVGAICGTYSSVFTAAPLLFVITERFNKSSNLMKGVKNGS